MSQASRAWLVASGKSPSRAASVDLREQATSRANFPKEAAKITGDMPQLLALFDYPAERWVHLRTPIESTFATVRHRTKVAKGPGSRAAGLAMAFKFIESAQDHWRWSTHPISSPWSAPERPSPAASSSKGLASKPSPKPPKRS